MGKRLYSENRNHNQTPRFEVWEALTSPQMIQQYLFGTQVTTDWQVGSPITYRGVWQGKP